MHLVMFDIDGTLTETMKVDEECFVRSFKDVSSPPSTGLSASWGANARSNEAMSAATFANRNQENKL